MQITTNQLRTQWLKFWQSKNHAMIPSSGVIPENDPTALFHNSGMHPLVPYLMGEKHPLGTRLTNAQKCIRTGDIDEVGDATHLTFFEMLGNWSLGDFFKAEQIPWAYEFLIEVLNLPVERLAVSVFEGNKNTPKDIESLELWKKSGLPASRLAVLDANENWWAKGEIGPCGPDSEIFYWTGNIDDPELKKPYQETWEDSRWVEIWNNVFMEFDKKSDGTLAPLPKKNIDTGMGLERTVAVLNGKKSVYETDAFTHILEAISTRSKKPDLAKNPTAETAMHHSARIIADHLRSSTIILADQIAPSNVDQGYVLRRLIRRSIRHGRNIGILNDFCAQIAEVVIEDLKRAYPELENNKKFILEALKAEEQQFKSTLEKGEKKFEKMVQNLGDKKIITGAQAFDLFQTDGFPLEMTIELSHEKNLTVDKEGFSMAFKAHQKTSQKGSEQKFLGGLADHSEKTTKLHSATHLLLAGLQEVLGKEVHQKGSNITAERLRFDFNYDQKLTPEQKQAVEDYVNQAIAAEAALEQIEMDKAVAQNSGVEGSFWEKYPDKVKVFIFTDKTGKVWSKELCGGPHVSNTGLIKSFKIKKESSSSRGIRRIKAIIEE